MTELPFEILVDDALAEISSAPELIELVNNRVLSLINDFEDANWRYPKFQSYLWDNIALTALSEKERSALVDQSHSSLVAAARNLRLTDNDKIGQGSEIAEVFLYGLMRHRLGALPVVPKIFYKQNVQDNAKGADSVHIVLNGDDFSLWFGEAKFYNSIADARLDAVVTSVINSLSTDKLKKENSIITNVADLDGLPIAEDLRARIKAALDNKLSIDSLKSRIHVPILLLHECSATSGATDLTEAYKAEIITAHKERAEAYFRKQIAKAGSIHKYNEIRFHLILFPVPSKKKIVDAFVQAVAFYKGQK
ncbi:MAG: DUF1837 domain-containing protein [Hyphomonas sp.]|uniref:HamA C-terminal domain-containing protein n=1 Tax=Hyphomonas sp. TaxID=87 RepID=UPI0017A8F3D4|nr:DUF1837 domain-containing protein [Hyphomonas sp.]MBA3069887.1 DUF1837 domain-containing protein [Hyphomonas sp.]MBU4063582.1 DUF1837 domain-containing protein [Alphaproteobacteria bacterium]MBU4163267.1 DUF1837 domain-containing protein [Alphaproteobacteria bacterium]